MRGKSPTHRRAADVWGVSRPGALLPPEPLFGTADERPSGASPYLRRRCWQASARLLLPQRLELPGVRVDRLELAGLGIEGGEGARLELARHPRVHLLGSWRRRPSQADELPQAKV